MNSILETLRCFKCQGYLSQGPLHVLNDENTICGRCFESSTTNRPSGRILNLENSLKNNKIKFPCKYQNDGCTEFIIFNSDHEQYCLHQSVSCPMPNCEIWKGKIFDIYEHFNLDHQESIENHSRIKLQLDEYSNKVFIICLDVGLKLIAKYCYTNDNFGKHFECDIRYLATSIDAKQNISCNIQSVNSNCESYTNLLVNYCIKPFSTSFIGMRKAFSLSSLELEKQCNLKCRTVELNLEIINEQNNNIHQETCQNHLIPCFISNCKTFYKIDSAVKHLETHKDVKHIEEGTFHIEFSKSCQQMYVYTIKNGVFIGMSYNVTNVHISVELFLESNKTVFLQFKHQHCDTISKQFHLACKKKTDIALDELPSCFKNSDELTAYIGLPDVPTSQDCFEFYHVISSSQEKSLER
ncbi:hypothetical protein ILUMI_08078 [Ignelater luminosus]|uniref:SIAH-type domain-containing protein n=1 Tax=Ignelater luminosus TaxID=2038154 RepID=A0A8K0D7K3_IGNLU|nr:hypothetical protein ILUMI_08078 [Ignelater luminosus]